MADIYNNKRSLEWGVSENSHRISNVFFLMSQNTQLSRAQFIRFCND